MLVLGISGGGGRGGRLGGGAEWGDGVEEVRWEFGMANDCCCRLLYIKSENSSHNIFSRTTIQNLVGAL